MGIAVGEPRVPSKFRTQHYSSVASVARQRGGKTLPTRPSIRPSGRRKVESSRATPRSCFIEGLCTVPIVDRGSTRMCEPCYALRSKRTSNLRLMLTRRRLTPHRSRARKIRVSNELEDVAAAASTPAGTTGHVALRKRKRADETSVGDTKRQTKLDYETFLYLFHAQWTALLHASGCLPSGSSPRSRPSL